MGILTIGKKEFEYEEKLLNQIDLKFYPDNPRIYSIVYKDGTEPTQAEIEKVLKEKEHVKELKNAILQNGGLIEPLLIRKINNEYIVLEGNSRLAAYRILAATDPIKWAKVKCDILPESITDDEIFLLLGQVHIVGKTPWSIFEQAGYLYRTVTTTGKTVEDVAKPLGISLTEAKKQYEVYSFMVEKGDTISSHWSYYEVLWRDRGLKKYMSTNSAFVERVVEDIQAEKFQAIELRDKLGAIAKDNSKDSTKIMQRYIDGTVSIEDAYESFHDTGKDKNVYKVIQKFRTKITDDVFQNSIFKAAASGKANIGFEIKRTIKSLETIKAKLEDKK